MKLTSSSPLSLSVARRLARHVGLAESYGVRLVYARVGVRLSPANGAQPGSGGGPSGCGRT